MRNIELPKFAGAAVLTIEDAINQALQKGTLKKVKNKEENTVTFKSSKKYDGYRYEFNILQEFSINKITTRKKSELLMSGLYTSKASWQKMIDDGSFELMSSYQFYVSNLCTLKKAMSDLEIDIFDDKYHLFQEDMEKYEDILKQDLNTIFDISEKYDTDNEFILGSDIFHKHKIGTKDIISHTNVDACVTAFILYEQDSETGEIRVIEELEQNVDRKFKRKTTVIGKYPEIVEHYIRTSVPSVIIRDNAIVKNNNPHVVLRTYLNASAIRYKIALEEKKHATKKS